MNAIFLAVVVLLPVVGGILVPLLPFRKRLHRLAYVEAVVLANSVLAFLLLTHRPESGIVIFEFTSNLTLSLKLDGLGTVFVGILSALWPFATLYAFEYMEHEEHETIFFMFYTITFGITMGIALAEDVVTMYCFYEMLTLITLPLVMHTLTREAILASRTYLYYSLGGAAFAFMGVIFILIYGKTANFVPGGVLDLEKIGDKTNLLLLIYVFCFFGFSVKAAMFPFCRWLPKAGVAPTPVTALLHAVAVVKAGAFAIMRVTYDSFGTQFLRGSWAQTVVLIPVIFTIVYGCSRALKETHIKRRLAWSTVSNLSYILFGVALMTPLGLVGALCHMICHALMKICSFFCMGAVICKSGREYIFQLDGLGRRMPKVFAAFTLSGMALMGVPGLCGFISKWNLVKAAVETRGLLAYLGIAALMISALLTAIYMLSVSVRAFSCQSMQTERPVTEPSVSQADQGGADAENEKLVPYEEVRDPGWRMLLPLAVFVIAMFGLGLHPQPVIDGLFGLVGTLR
ncbi:MAG: proton-conducting membrane transporter [Clostridiales bacterium]|nr:proton-conducting membrane transporter [Clostridiales bacterium]